MISSDDLLDFLRKIDEKLKWKVTLVSVGGTAMTLAGLKDSTIDIDLCIETKQDYDMFKKEKDKFKKIIKKVDLFLGGYIFCVQLPEDYLKKSKLVKTNFKNIELRFLNPVDIVVTKTFRLNERDMEDIQSVLKTKKVSKEKFKSRFNEVKDSYAGSEDDANHNFRVVLREF
ncbi:MAG: DUF6036 family nucleotidyltransferase [Nanoarchaeota archaeon]|nr:DUF6036 family nucleotidyltransferase [Nanoarchaeota archaeon]